MAEPISEAYETVEPGSARLAPVANRPPWLISGLVLQIIGAGVPAGYVISTAKHMNAAGHLSSATVRLAWRSDSHTATGLTLLLVGAAVFAIGSTLMARPYVTRRSTLLVAVPIAAVVGVLVLGVLAILLWALWEGGFEPSFGSGNRGPRKKRQDRRR